MHSIMGGVAISVLLNLETEQSVPAHRTSLYLQSTIKLAKVSLHINVLRKLKHQLLGNLKIV